MKKLLSLITISVISISYIDSTTSYLSNNDLLSNSKKNIKNNNIQNKLISINENINIYSNKNNKYYYGLIYTHNNGELTKYYFQLNENNNEVNDINSIYYKMNVNNN